MSERVMWFAFDEQGRPFAASREDELAAEMFVEDAAHNHGPGATVRRVEGDEISRLLNLMCGAPQ